MRRSLHPELAKRAILRDRKAGAERFSHLTRDRMVEKTAQGGGKDDVPPDQRIYDIAILDISGEIANFSVELAEYIDYLHLARASDHWVIVNVLWGFRGA